MKKTKWTFKKVRNRTKVISEVKSILKEDENNEEIELLKEIDVAYIKK